MLRTIKYIWGFGVFFLLITIFLIVVGVRFNTSKSINIGFYLSSSDKIQKNAYVEFCPPDAPIFRLARDRGYISIGPCPGNYMPMMKKIVGIATDKIETTEEGVAVNGYLLPYSKVKKFDLGGRILEIYYKQEYTLDNDEVLLMTDISETSFDARYFGPIKVSQIRTVIYPLLTWD